MTVTETQIQQAITNGMKEDAVNGAALAANSLGASFYQLLALMAQESTDGSNIWGGDVGPLPGRKDDGTFSGLKDLITESSWRAFRHEVIVCGKPSNGVGPMQITYPGYFTQMEGRGLKPPVVADSILFGSEKYWNYYKRARARGYGHSSGVRWAGTWYNAGPDEEELVQPYADKLLKQSIKWKAIVGIVDTQN